MASAVPKKNRTKGKTKSPRCKTCGSVIRVPEGWTKGPAVRRHYWAKHPERMRPSGSAEGSKSKKAKR